MREAGLVVASIHEALRGAVRPGITTRELDEVSAQAIADGGATSNFKGYYGYPRSVEQAHVLRDMLLDLGKSIDVVLEIQVDEDEVVERMLKRAQEQHRTDDTEPVMRHRLEVYHQQTEPVATYYVDQDLLEVVDGSGTIDEVTARIFAILDSVAKN